ncbi:MAG: hypothetical protein ACFWTJ_15580 [Lachnoclostridium sp.]
MRMNNEDYRYKSFLNYFHIKNEEYLCQLYSLGWQLRTSTKYDWDGRKRAEDRGQCIFQYTLSGFGKLDYDNKSVILDKGSAFLVTLPDEHRYYLPPESKKWEFLFITLSGEYTLKVWKQLQQQYGKVIKLPSKSKVLQLLWNIYWEFAKKKVSDEYQTSVIAYQFIMELIKTLEKKNEIELRNNNNINLAIEYMKNNIHLPLTLEDIARSANLSKYYFSRLFTSLQGMTPWEYLSKLRMEKAVYLLQTHSYQINEIAEMVGYSSVNYFDKAFRKAFNTSPGKFELMYKGIDEK